MGAPLEYQKAPIHRSECLKKAERLRKKHNVKKCVNEGCKGGRVIRNGTKPKCELCGGLGFVMDCPEKRSWRHQKDSCRCKGSRVVPAKSFMGHRRLPHHRRLPVMERLLE